MMIANTKEDILAVTKQFIGPGHRMGKKYYGNQWGPSTVWSPIFFKIYSIVFSRRKKLNTVMEQLEGK